MNEDDLRAFDDEDAFAIRMDYEKYDENGFPSLLLGPDEETNIIEKEQQQQQHELTAAIDDVFLPDAPELGGGADVHLPRFSDGDYVRINPRYFYPSPERWPSGYILSTERARGGGGDNTTFYEVEIVSEIYEGRDESVGTITIPEKHIEMFYGFDYEEGEDRGAGGNDDDDETTDEVLVLGDDGREAILIDVEDEETNGIEVECGKFTAGGTKKWLYSVNFMHETDKSVNAKDARRVRKEKLDAKRRERRWKPRRCTHTPHKTFAGTRSWKIRAFYIVSLSVYFLRRKKRKNWENWGKRKRKRERERRFTLRATRDIEREKR